MLNRDTSRQDLPPAVFEALVGAWADLLVTDYYARHRAPDAVAPTVLRSAAVPTATIATHQ
jgi:hypothetical protein